LVLLIVLFCPFYGVTPKSAKASRREAKAPTSAAFSVTFATFALERCFSAPVSDDGGRSGRIAVDEIFRNRWWFVFASVCGLLVGAGPVNVFAFAVFLKPVTESLGVGRELCSSGLIVGSTVAGIGLIPLGFLLDHYRVRRVMMPGLVLYAAGVMGYALMTPSPLHIYLAFAIAAPFGPIGSPLPYGAVLSRWFDRQRGLAIGIAMAGVGLGVALVPQIAAVLIRVLGWRLAYVALGGVILLVAWVPVTLLVREPSERDAAAHADIAVERDLGARKIRWLLGAEINRSAPSLPVQLQWASSPKPP
jgi:MFS family permease